MNAFVSFWKPILNRVKEICLSPKSGWTTLAASEVSLRDLYLSFILPLAALAPVAQLLKMLTFGEASRSDAPRIRWPIWDGIVTALGLYLMFIIATLFLTLAASKLAPRFGGALTFRRANQLVAYSLAPAYVVGVLNIVPGLGIVPAVLGLYGLYLYWEAIPVFAGVESQENRAKFFALSLVGAFLLGLIVSLIVQNV